MAIYINGNRVVNSLVIDGQIEGISLVNTCRIGVTASNKAQSPVDANNYIDVSGTTVTLKRNNNTYHLWIYSPQLLQVGKAYAFVFDSITNYDDCYYIEYTSDITANPIVATRIGYADSDNILNGFVIEPTVSAYYGVAIWRNNTNDIVVNNPRFVEIGKNTGGGGPVTPTFSETDLVDKSTLASSFTFSEDYNNYQFLRFRVYNSSWQNYFSIITTPESINAIMDITSYIDFNDFGNNQYACYSYSADKLTWTRNWQRNLNIFEVVGLNCTNATVTKTQIYKAAGASGSSVSITSQDNLLEFDWIIFTANDGDTDEIQPCYNVFCKNDYDNSSINAVKGETEYYFPFNGYNYAGIIKISEYSIWSSPYAYIQGIKFTPT